MDQFRATKSRSTGCFVDEEIEESQENRKEEERARRDQAQTTVKQNMPKKQDGAEKREKSGLKIRKVE